MTVADGTSSSLNVFMRLALWWGQFESTQSSKQENLTEERSCAESSLGHFLPQRISQASDVLFDVQFALGGL